MPERSSREPSVEHTADSGSIPTDADPATADADPAAVGSDPESAVGSDPESAVSPDPAEAVDPDPGTAVDESLKRRLREAYLNDEEDELVVTAVRMEGDEAVVETRPPHGETTHVERFDAPTDGSLEECTELLAFLDVVGVSPLDLDGLVGARVPATYDPDDGWRIAGEFRSEDDAEPARTAAVTARVGTAANTAVDWARTYRDWLLVLLLVGGELLFVAVVILLFT